MLIGGAWTYVAGPVITWHVLIFRQCVDVIDLTTFTDRFIATFSDLARVDLTNHGPVVVSLLSFWVIPSEKPLHRVELFGVER